MREQMEYLGQLSLKGHLAREARVKELEEALLTSTTMLEALLVQLNSWGHESAVNARDRIWKNEELLAVTSGLLEK